MLSGILKAGMAVTAALLIGRLLGFGREATIAAVFGVSREADVAIFLIGLPDLLVNILGSGGFTAVLVVALRKAPERAIDLAIQAGLAVLALVAAIIILPIALSGALVDLLAPGFDDIAHTTSANLLPIVLLSAPIAAATGATAAYLQSQERFFIASIGTAIINLTLILALLATPLTAELQILVAAILAGSMFRWLIQVLAIGRRKLTQVKLRPWLVSSRVAVDFLRTAATESIVFFYPFALRAIATLFGIGALASVNYATKLVQLPLGVVVMTLTTVLLPRLASAAPGNGSTDTRPFMSLAEAGCYWILGLSALSVAVLAAYGGVLVNLAFGWGEISPEDLRQITFYTAVFSLSLLPTGLNVFLRRALNAMDETRAPMIAELTGFVVFISAAVLVISSGRPIELVLLAATVGNLAATCVLCAAFSSNGAPVPALLIRPSIWFPALIAAGVAWLPGRIAAHLYEDGLWTQAIAGMLGGSLGLLALLFLHPTGRRVLQALSRRTARH